MGYLGYILAALLADLAQFDERFAKCISAEKQLEAAKHPALRARLSEIQADCKRTTSLIRDMHEDRLASAYPPAPAQTWLKTLDYQSSVGHSYECPFVPSEDSSCSTQPASPVQFEWTTS